MAGSYPSINDREFDLWKRLCWNWYNYATNFGVTGINPPNINDTKEILMKKTAYITAAFVDISL